MLYLFVTCVSAQEIVSAICDMPVLKALNLEGNTLGTDAAKAIGKALENHKEFKVMKGDYAIEVAVLQYIYVLSTLLLPYV